MSEDPFIEPEVKEYVLNKLRTDNEGNILDSPVQLALRNQAAMLQVTQLLRTLILEVHLMRVANCRHLERANGVCGVVPCAPGKKEDPGLGQGARLPFTL